MMTTRHAAGALVGTALLLGLGLRSARADEPRPAQKGATTTMHARGAFEVKLNPLALADASADASLGRLSFDKQYHGDLEGAGKGEMLTAGSVAKGSAGYVAVERVSGTLQGRSGSFALQHSGTLNHGAQQLSITVVPESGTGQLAGIAGAMTIRIEDGGKHFYDLEYTLNP
jgi:hypothetical protein